MNRLKAILIFQLILNGFCFGQNSADKLLGFQYSSFTIANGFENTCLIEKGVKQDTLTIKVFTQFDCHKLIGFVSLDKDTLELNCHNDYMEKGETYHDIETGEYMTTITMKESVCCGKCGFILNFRVSSEYKDLPILFNNQMIDKCNNRIQYDLMQADTINKIDKFGMRQGTWMTFHANGGLASLDTFRNDQIIIGYRFNNSGKTIAKTIWDGNQTMTFESLTDSTFFKELLNAPDIKKKTNDE